MTKTRTKWKFINLMNTPRIIAVMSIDITSDINDDGCVSYVYLLYLMTWVDGVRVSRRHLRSFCFVLFYYIGCDRK